MRHFIGVAVRFLLLASLVASLPSGLLARGPNSFAREAELEYWEGDYESAKAKFKALLDAPSKRVMAKDYLEKIAAAEAAPGAGTIARLRKLEVPLVEFRETRLDTAFEYLSQQVTKASDGELKPTFVVQPGVDRTATLTLRLENASFRDILRYLSQLMAVQFTIDQEIITVHPRVAAENANPPAPPPL